MSTSNCDEHGLCRACFRLARPHAPELGHAPSQGLYYRPTGVNPGAAPLTQRPVALGGLSVPRVCVYCYTARLPCPGLRLAPLYPRPPRCCLDYCAGADDRPVCIIRSRVFAVKCS